MADQVAQERVAGSGIAGTLFRDPPIVTVTAPSGPQGTETVTVSWTFVSGVSKPQYSYRVQILDQVGTTVLFDSGIQLGTGLSYDCPFVLSGGSIYTVKVICSDGADEGVGVQAFSSSLVDVGDFGLSSEVGAVYEVAINGVGYMLKDTPERPYRRSIGQLQAPRLATGETPFSEAVDRYSFSGTGDWSLGAGQKYGNSPTSDARAFWSSQSVNPFEPGSVSLLNATSELLASSTGAVGAVVASGHLFCATASNTVKRMTSVGASPDTMTFTGDTLVDLASDGTYWYALNTDDEIFRGTGTTIGAVWANLATPAAGSQIIEWCTDRLAVVYTNGSGQSVLSTLSPAGAEEVTDGRFKFTGASITAVTSGDGYLWFSVNRTDRSVIYAWKLGSTDGAFIATDLPKGESVTGLFFYLGNVMIRVQTSDGGSIYRAVPAAGELTLERIVDIETAGGGLGGMTGAGKFVLFGWKGMSDDGRSGVGCIDLSTGGWCRWLQSPTAGDNGAVPSLFVWNDDIGFLVDGSGPMIETPNLEPSGYIVSSVMDMASSLTKVFDAVSLALENLPANSSVSISASYDAGVSFTSIGTISTPGLRYGRWDLGKESASISVKLTLAATGLVSPTVSRFQVKLHALSLVDQVVELPISCAERQTGLNGIEIQSSVGGLVRARVLESLVGTRVVLQDVDYPSTGVAETWEMVSAEYSSVGMFSRRHGSRKEAHAVCVCTLRRAQ